jgi:restriction system protein
MSYRDLKSYQQAEIICDFTVEFCDRYVENWDTDYRTDRTDRNDMTNRTDRNDKTYRSYRSYRNTSYRHYSRQSDQMLQAARSGKQNIVEGANEKTSKRGEIELTSVARASFQELLEDYEDFLRQKGLKMWSPESAEARAVRELAYKPDRTYKSYCSFLDDPETAANAMICLINQTNFLLDRQIGTLEKNFVVHGGYRENLSKKREDERKKVLMRNLYGR